MALTTTPSELTATALTLTTAAQPNITSVGTLTGLNITTADNTSQLILTSTDADSSAGPVLELFRNSGSPDDNDATGLIYFYGENDNDEKIAYSQIYTQVKDASDGTEDGSMAFYTMAAGTSTETLTLNSGKVGIGIPSPLTALHVHGSGKAFLFDPANSTIGNNIYYNGSAWDSYDHSSTGAVFQPSSDGSFSFRRATAADPPVLTYSMYIDTAGKVGIADTTPAEKLSVTGAILSEGDHATAVNAMGAAAGILMHATGDTAYITATSNGNNHRYLSLRALNTGAANAHQVFLSYTGNVGIGTNTPGNTFVVKGAASTSPILEMINSDAEDGNTGRESTIRFSGFRSGGEAMINGQITGTHLDSGDDDKGGLTFFSNNGSGIAERMRLDQWGRLGIGTDSPIAGLSVKATSANQNTYLIHAHRPDGLAHAAEPFSSILIQNQETTAGYQYDGMTIMAPYQAHLRFQTGNTGSWGGTGAKRWQLRMGIGNNVDQLSVYSWTAATEVLTMNTSGATLLQSVGANYALQVGTGHGNYGTGALNSSYQHTVVISGPTNFYWGNPCYASGGFSTYSDEKLKKEVTLIPDALTKVKKMKGVTFKWIDADKRGGARVGKQFGVTAQNMLEIDSELPELSVDPLAEEGKEESSEKYYTMDYTRITPFLIEAIKEQQTLIETLQTKVAALEAK